LTQKKEAERKRALNILSYYEFDALPILLYKLKNTDPRDPFLSELIGKIKTTSRINKGKTKKFVKELVTETEELFIREYQKEMEFLQIQGVINYVKLLGEIGHSNSSEIKSLFELIRNKLTALFEETQNGEKEAVQIMIDILDNEIKSSEEKLSLR